MADDHPYKDQLKESRGLVHLVQLVAECLSEHARRAEQPGFNVAYSFWVLCRQLLLLKRLLRHEYLLSFLRDFDIVAAMDCLWDLCNKIPDHHNELPIDRSPDWSVHCNKNLASTLRGIPVDLLPRPPELIEAVKVMISDGRHAESFGEVARKLKAALDRYEEKLRLPPLRYRFTPVLVTVAEQKPAEPTDPSSKASSEYWITGSRRELNVALGKSEKYADYLERQKEKGALEMQRNGNEFRIRLKDPVAHQEAYEKLLALRRGKKTV